MVRNSRANVGDWANSLLALTKVLITSYIGVWLYLKYLDNKMLDQIKKYTIVTGCIQYEK